MFIICLIIYFLSAVIVRQAFLMRYTKENLEIGKMEIIITLLPILNTFIVLVGLYKAIKGIINR